MAEDLIVGIVRILTPDGSTAGTDFIVADEGLIATCAHVVWPADDRKPAGLGGCESLNHQPH